MSTTHPIPDAALDSDIAILAQKGAGKTYTAKGLIEELLSQGARVLVIDPLSVWWGLKANRDGKSAGFPVAVFGGPHGDMPLTEAMAEPLAKTLAHTNLPAVLDVAWMKKAEQMRFCAKLFETLFAENRDPLTLVLEEAHVFAPQSMTGGDAHCFHQVDRIARMGRAFGFRLVTITQRPARLHKDVLTQAAGMIALRMQHPLDQKPILDWFTANADKAFSKRVESELANLSTGEAFVGFPDQQLFAKVKFPLIKSFDSSATPKRGETRIQPKTLAQVDLSAIKAALALPEPEKAAPAAKSKDWQTETDRLVREAREAGFSEGHKKGMDSGINVGIMMAQKALSKLSERQSQPAPDTASDARPAPAPAKPKATAPAFAAGSGLTGPQSKVIEALGFWQALGFDAPTRAQIAAAAGYSPSSGGFNNLLGGLRSAGLIEYPSGGVVSLTAAATGLVPPTSSGRVRDRLGAVLSGPQAKILDALMDGRELSRDHLGMATGYSPTSGGFNNLLGSLRSLGIVSYPSKGFVRVEPWVLMEIA